MKVKKAWLIDFYGIERLPQLEGKELSLKAMYPIVGNGCHTIEHVGLKKGVDMWVDEEGLLKDGNVINRIATGMYRAAYPHVDPAELGIVGRAIVTDNTKKGDYIKG
jgi:hypothetical protein